MPDTARSRRVGAWERGSDLDIQSVKSLKCHVQHPLIVAIDIICFKYPTIAGFGGYLRDFVEVKCHRRVKSLLTPAEILLPPTYMQ